jgi:hypothetical protein
MHPFLKGSFCPVPFPGYTLNAYYQKINSCRKNFGALALTKIALLKAAPYTCVRSKSIFVAKLCVVLNFYILINNDLTPVQKFKTP